MHDVGNIDVTKYSEISDKIISNEVVITDNRIEHIIERRGEEFYEKYSPLFSEILKSPDYIFKDNKINTALVCKKVVSDEKYVNLVLRVVIEGEDSNYKNSIITAIGENEKRFNQRLRNNEPIYAKNIDISE